MTQNYCNTGNFRHVWLKTARGRPRFCHKWYRVLKRIGRDDLIAVAHEVSKNNPEHFPNMELDLSSSDSSSDTSSQSSDDSSASVEVVEPLVAKSSTNSSSSIASVETETGSSSQDCQAVTARDELSSLELELANKKTECESTNQNGASGANANAEELLVSSSDTSDDDSGMEEQDKKRFL